MESIDFKIIFIRMPLSNIITVSFWSHFNILFLTVCNPLRQAMYRNGILKVILVRNIIGCIFINYLMLYIYFKEFWELLIKCLRVRNPGVIIAVLFTLFHKHVTGTLRISWTIISVISSGVINKTIPFLIWQQLPWLWSFCSLHLFAVIAAWPAWVSTGQQLFDYTP